MEEMQLQPSLPVLSMTQQEGGDQRKNKRAHSRGMTMNASGLWRVGYRTLTP